MHKTLHFCLKMQKISPRAPPKWALNPRCSFLSTLTLVHTISSYSLFATACKLVNNPQKDKAENFPQENSCRGRAHTVTNSLCFGAKSLQTFNWKSDRCVSVNGKLNQSSKWLRTPLTINNRKQEYGRPNRKYYISLSTIEKSNCEQVSTTTNSNNSNKEISIFSFGRHIAMLLSHSFEMIYVECCINEAMTFSPQAQHNTLFCFFLFLAFIVFLLLPLGEIKMCIIVLIGECSHIFQLVSIPQVRTLQDYCRRRHFCLSPK